MAIINIVREIKWVSDLFGYQDFVCCRDYITRLKNKKMTLRITEFQSSVFTAISEDSIIYCSYNELAESMIMIGALSICKNYDIEKSICENIITVLRKHKKSLTNSTELNEIIEKLEDLIDISKSEDVANVLDYYSNSKVVRNLHIRIYGKEPLNFNKKNKISAGVIGRCFDLLSKELDTSFFNIKGEKNNKEICIYIPQEFVSLFSNLRKDLFQTQLFSEITRMCFSQGLYILSDLIVKGEIDFTDRMTKSATNSLRNIYLKYYK